LPQQHWTIVILSNMKYAELNATSVTVNVTVYSSISGTDTLALIYMDVH